MTLSERTLLDVLHGLSSQEFERQVARLLEAEGYRDVRVQGGSNDRGVDIVCLDTEGRLVAVQCKRFAPTATVSALVVQHLVGMAVKSKAHRAMLVTTGSFTGPARTQAEDYDIELINGARLASLIAVHPALVATLGIGDVSVETVRRGVQPRPAAPVTPARSPAARETLTDGSWFYRLTHRFPALTEENIAVAVEWGKKTLCPPAGEGCKELMSPFTPAKHGITADGAVAVG